MKKSKNQEEFDFTGGKKLTLLDLTDAQLRSVSKKISRCKFVCKGCSCPDDIRSITAASVLGNLTFNSSGNPNLSMKQIAILKSRREEIISSDDSDEEKIRVIVPPAPLDPSMDDDL